MTFRHHIRGGGAPLKTENVVVAFPLARVERRTVYDWDLDEYDYLESLGEMLEDERRKPYTWDDLHKALDERRRRPVRWFYWGDTVAVVAGMDAFSAGAKGWRPVNEAEVTWDGLEISEAEARKAFSESFETFGDPPIRSLRERG
jgi:hypothetical protein